MEIHRTSIFRGSPECKARLTRSARKRAVLDGPNLDEKVDDGEDGERDGGDRCLVLVVVDGDGKDHAEDVDSEDDDTQDEHGDGHKALPFFGGVL